MELLKPREVAPMFGVTTKTVRRWVRQGKIPCIKTPGGHHRFPKEQIEAMVRESGERGRGSSE